MSRYLLDTDIASCIIKGNSSAVARATRYGSNAKDRVWDSGGVAWKAGPPATAAGAATMPDEFGTHRVCATDRASAPQGISEVRSSLSRGTLRKELLTAGISIWRWPSPNLSREPARHRDLPRRGVRQAVPHGFSQQLHRMRSEPN